MRLASALWAVVLLMQSVAAGAPALAANGLPDAHGIREWKVSCSGEPQSVAIGGNGRVFFAATSTDQILAFGPTGRTTESWQLDSGTLPRTLAVDPSGNVFFTARSGPIGRLDPQSGEVRRYAIEGAGAPYWVAIAGSGRVWFSDPAGRRIGAFDQETGDTVFFDIAARPYAITIDAQERIWTVLSDEDGVGVLDPRTGVFRRIQVGAGARPRAIAAAPDGMIWSVLAGSAALLRIDGRHVADLVEYRAPPGLGAPDSLAISADGTVWVSYKGGQPIWRIDRVSRALEMVDASALSHAPRATTVDRGGKVWAVSAGRGTVRPPR
jgi:virginiamycin B lyase